MALVAYCAIYLVLSKRHSAHRINSHQYINLCRREIIEVIERHERCGSVVVSIST